MFWIKNNSLDECCSYLDRYCACLSPCKCFASLVPLFGLSPSLLFVMFGSYFLSTRAFLICPTNAFCLLHNDKKNPTKTQQLRLYGINADLANPLNAHILYHNFSFLPCFMSYIRYWSMPFLPRGIRCEFCQKPMLTCEHFGKIAPSYSTNDEKMLLSFGISPMLRCNVFFVSSNYDQCIPSIWGLFRYTEYLDSGLLVFCCQIISMSTNSIHFVYIQTCWKFMCIRVASFSIPFYLPYSPSPSLSTPQPHHSHLTTYKFDILQFHFGSRAIQKRQVLSRLNEDNNNNSDYNDSRECRKKPLFVVAPLFEYGMMLVSLVLHHFSFVNFSLCFRIEWVVLWIWGNTFLWIWPHYGSSLSTPSGDSKNRNVEVYIYRYNKIVRTTKCDRYLYWIQEAKKDDEICEMLPLMTIKWMRVQWIQRCWYYPKWKFLLTACFFFGSIEI